MAGWYIRLQARMLKRAACDYSTINAPYRCRLTDSRFSQQPHARLRNHAKIWPRGGNLVLHVMKTLPTLHIESRGSYPIFHNPHFPSAYMVSKTPESLMACRHAAAAYIVHQQRSMSCISEWFYYITPIAKRKL